MKKTIALAVLFPLLFACGKEEVKKDDTTIIEYQETSKSPATSTPATTNHIVLKAQEDMTFSATEFTVKAGEEITLLLTNTGTSSKEAMGHNVVILQPGTDVNAFSFKASSEKATDYIPTNAKQAIVAHTKLLGPKESDQVKFTLETPGTYEFICTFPGHSATMRGTITAIP